MNCKLFKYIKPLSKRDNTWQKENKKQLQNVKRRTTSIDPVIILEVHLMFNPIKNHIKHVIRQFWRRSMDFAKKFVVPLLPKTPKKTIENGKNSRRILRFSWQLPQCLEKFINSEKRGKPWKGMSHQLRIQLRTSHKKMASHKNMIRLFNPSRSHVTNSKWDINTSTRES